MIRINPPATKTELRRIPERHWLKSDKNIQLVAFYPFRDFYGGYLVYLRNGIKYKEFLCNALAKKLGLKEVYIYGGRAI